MLLLVLTMMFRYGSFDIDTFYTASGTLISYGLGHLPAFDMWYVGHVEDLSEFTFGGKTLYGLTNTLGILSREQGVFTKCIKSHLMVMKQMYLPHLGFLLRILALLGHLFICFL